MVSLSNNTLHEPQILLKLMFLLYITLIMLPGYRLILHYITKEHNINYITRELNIDTFSTYDYTT